MEFTLTEYINAAMALAEYDKLDDGSFAGRLPKCKGVIAFAKTLKGCEDELRSTLEDWIIVKLKTRALPAKLEQIHDALSYYYEHKAMLDKKYKDDQAFLAQLKKQYPSKLRAKLA